MPAATEGMITGCRPSLRCSRTTAVRDFSDLRCICANDRFGEPFNKRSFLGANHPGLSIVARCSLWAPGVPFISRSGLIVAVSSAPRRQRQPT